MEISGFVLPRAQFGTIDGGSRRFRASVRVPTRAACGGVVFSDEAHLKYYGGTKEEEKKRMKLIKGIKKDLFELSSMGFGGEADQSNKISEMAEQLLEQLNQLKIEEKEMKKEMKKKKKEQKAAMKKGCEDSSSSSSESSESDCEKTKTMMISSNSTKLLYEKPQMLTSSNNTTTKIEVCMGGKCKKNGAVELLNEIEKKVGIEGAVMGCKCMGKCKEGPNLSVLKETKSPLLCIGVGFDDVDTIVGQFFEAEKDDSELENQLVLA